MGHRSYHFLFLFGVLFVLSSVLLKAEGDSARYAVIKEATGKVDVRMQGQDWQAAKPDMILHQRDEIRTGNDSRAKILLDKNGSTGQLELRPNSLLNLDTLLLNSKSGDKTTYLQLAIGHVLVHAEKLHGDSKFEIRTPTSTTGVRGTTFEVGVEEQK